ncbi:MAG TPA: FadR/GntR family transcriptional regulator [Bryobacteraceae bacterium]|jgi:GntR family transcriptional repressor for pyruvate dehydrogenase complex
MVQAEHMKTERRSTADLIERFRLMIAGGEIARGDRLPSERELALRFGTSRSSLRHALKVLHSVGIISQRVGDGTYLSKDASRILEFPLAFLLTLDGISVLELFDMRLMIEPEFAAKAAERAHGRSLDAIRNTLSSMLTETAEADAAFHEAVCTATGNRVCQRMFSAIQHAFRAGMQVTTKLAPPERALEFHKQIYSAIHLRQPAEARERMIDHLTDAQGVLLAAHLEGKLPKSFH